MPDDALALFVVLDKFTFCLSEVVVDGGSSDAGFDLLGSDTTFFGS